jgi:hypothetical protein
MLADSFKHAHTRDRMLRIASDYDQIALKSLEHEWADSDRARKKARIALIGLKS